MPLLFLTSERQDISVDPEKKNPNSSFNYLLLLVVFLIVIGRWLYEYEDDAITVEQIEETLGPEELEAYKNAQQQVDDKFQNCIQYILYATEPGPYQCLSCPGGIPFVTLKKMEIWYIGHTCQDAESRHSISFRKKHDVRMSINYEGPKHECHRIELKLIRGYKYLPESIKPEGKLILPPYNQTDQY